METDDVTDWWNRNGFLLILGPLFAVIVIGGMWWSFWHGF